MNASRRNARGETTLQAILEETASLVARYGYDGTTIARITAATGKPASSIYWYFDTKDALVSAALESTYRTGAGGIPGWQGFDAGRGVEEQLTLALADEFTPADTEAPVRLGLMVALEGNAALSPAQEPFRRRRQRARGQVLDWWRSASAGLGCGGAEVSEWMSLLTIAFLDGHYISDTRPVADPARHTAAVARALAAAFEHLSSLEQPPGEPRRVPTGPAGGPSAESASSGQAAPAAFGGSATAADGEASTRDALLTGTRGLVAERGYEGATLAEICRRAQVQRSSIYWRFRSKDELVRDAVAEPFLALVGAACPTAPAGSDDWPEALAAAVEHSVQAAGQDPDAVKAGLLLKLQRRTPPSLGSAAIQAGLVDAQQALEQWIRDAAQAAGTPADAELLGWMTSVLVEGLLLSVAFGHRYDGSAVARIVAAMLTGAAAEAVRAPAPGRTGAPGSTDVRPAES